MESEDFARFADDLSHVDGGPTRSAADVEQRLTDRKSGAAPGVECARPPYAMLQTEARDLVIVGTEDIIAFSGCGHASQTRESNRSFGGDHSGRDQRPAHRVDVYNGL